MHFPMHVISKLLSIPSMHVAVIKLTLLVCTLLLGTGHHYTPSHLSYCTPGRMSNSCVIAMDSPASHIATSMLKNLTENQMVKTHWLYLNQHSILLLDDQLVLTKTLLKHLLKQKKSRRKYKTITITIAIFTIPFKMLDFLLRF